MDSLSFLIKYLCVFVEMAMFVFPDRFQDGVDWRLWIGIARLEHVHCQIKNGRSGP